MKIAIFTDAYEPHLSGVTTSIKMLKEALTNMGHEVYIVTANLEKYRFKYDKKNKIIYIPGVKTGIYKTRLTSVYSRKALKIIKTWNLDIIHSQTEFAIGTFSRIVAKKLNIPIVHTYHTMLEDYVHYVTHGHFDNFGKKIVIKLTKYFCEKKCDELIVPTDKIKELFVDKYEIAKHINVIPTGIDTTKFAMTEKMQNEVKKLKKKYNLNNDDFIIGCVGRIAKEKSLDKLLKSFKKLLELNNHVKLVIVGDGPELPELKKLANTLNIANKVTFTGLVQYDDIPTYYNLFNVMTSFSTTETQGLTIIEALASSMPVICIDDESFREMVQHNYNGFLFKTPQEFLDVTLKLINNEELYKTMCINAKNSIYRYSKEVFASEILKVYYKALDDKQKV